MDNTGLVSRTLPSQYSTEVTAPSRFCSCPHQHTPPLHHLDSPIPMDWHADLQGQTALKVVWGIAYTSMFGYTTMFDCLVASAGYWRQQAVVQTPSPVLVAS